MRLEERVGLAEVAAAEEAGMRRERARVRGGQHQVAAVGRAPARAPPWPGRGCPTA